MLKNKSKTLISLFAICIIVAICSALIVLYKNHNKSSEISIAYSTDSNYLYPTIVSMTSLMENTKKNTFCKFTVLTSDNVTQEMKENIKSLDKKYKNCNIDIIDMGENFSGSEEGFWSKAMYYRLNLPQILENEKICLYLDGDTIVRKDISEIFKIDMENYYIAGVRDINNYINSKSNYYEKIGIADLNFYVCSGVLLMNLEKMRNDNLAKRLEDLIKENDKNKLFQFPDQDALNVACYGHILTLPLKYGALAHTDFSESYKKSEYAQWVSNEKDWEEGRKDPIIVHFTGKKPWREIYSNLCKEWWSYANKTEFKDIISEKYKAIKNTPQT